MTSQFLAPALREGDEEVEQSLRPRRLDDFVGQERTKEQLDIALEAAKARGEALDHVCSSARPGLGKTTLATIIREELDVGIRTVAGPALERKGRHGAILTASTRRTSSSSTRSIASTARSRRSSIRRSRTSGSTSSSARARARTLTLDLPPFTLVGATTRTGCSRRRCATASG